MRLQSKLKRNRMHSQSKQNRSLRLQPLQRAAMLKRNKVDSFWGPYRTMDPLFPRPGVWLVSPIHFCQYVRLRSVALSSVGRAASLPLLSRWFIAAYFFTCIPRQMFPHQGLSKGGNWELRVLKSTFVLQIGSTRRRGQIWMSSEHLAKKESLSPSICYW